MFGQSTFGDYDADDDRDYDDGDAGFGSSDDGRRRRKRSNMFGDQRHNQNFFEFGKQPSTDGFADARDAYGEQFRRGEVDDDVNAAYVSFDPKRITDGDPRRTPIRDYAGTGDNDNPSAPPNFRPTKEQMDNLFSAIGSSSSTASSSVSTPVRPPPPPNDDARGATASSSSATGSGTSRSGSFRARRRRKRKSRSMSTSSSTTAASSSSATAKSLGSATTTSASEQEFLFSDEESPRARRRARKESRAPPPPPPASAAKDKPAATAMTIKYAPLNEVQKANDERAYGSLMAHDIELDMDDSSCDELERQLVGRRLRDETLRAARAEEGFTQTDRLRDQDSSASATDELMAGRMRSLNVRDRQLFVSTDDESDTGQKAVAAKKSFGPDEILARYALPGTASGAGQAMNCFICGYTRENAPIVPNRDLRQLLELFYNPNGTDLKRHARAVHVFYKTRIWRNAEWRQQNLPLWRTRDVYVCLTKHQVEPRLVMRKHLTMIDTMIQSTASAANLQAASGQVVPHRDNVRLVDVLLNRYWNLARIDPSKTNFYQARATPTVHAPGPYHIQTVRARMTTTTTTAQGGGGNRRNRFY